MADRITAESLHGAIGDRVRAVWEGNLRLLDWEDDFLAPFRRKEWEGGYVGMGKTLSGLIHAARHFGGEADELRERTVGALLETQDEGGYLGAYAEAARTFRCWDVHEQAYIIQALVENAVCFHADESLTAAERLARWLLPRLRDGAWQTIAGGEIWNPLAIIGLDRALLRLSEATGDKVYARFCRDDLDLPGWFDPIIEGRQEGVRGHAYAYLARCLAQLEMSRGDAALPPATQAVIAYLRAGGGLVVSGACGQAECWHSDQRVDGRLGETCTTAYLIRWAAHLLQRTHDAWFGDLMERAIYNALFAAASCDGRRIRYYSPAEGPRSWYDRDTYCCPGNYRRIVGELPDIVVRRHDDGIAIDLYEACRATVALPTGPVHLCIATDYPSAPEVVVHIDPEQAGVFPLFLRCPGWTRRAQIECNGEQVDAQPQSGWIRLQREWQPGDGVRLSFDMPWRLVRGFRHQRDRVAIMRGPVVWGAEPDDNLKHGDRLREFVPDVATCQLDADGRHATLSGDLDDCHVQLALAPFPALRCPVTYFTGRRGMKDESDHLLWLAPDRTGARPDPGG